MGVADVGGHVLRTSRISALCPPHFLQTLLSSVSSSRFVSPGPVPIRNGLNGKGRMHSQKSTTDKNIIFVRDFQFKYYGFWSKVCSFIHGLNINRILSYLS